jgi:hypothetical protein
MALTPESGIQNTEYRIQKPAAFKSCSEQATARRMGGRERLRPNRGFPATPGTTREPPQTSRCAQKTLAEPHRRIPNHHEPLVPFTTAGHLRGFMRFPGSAWKPQRFIRLNQRGFLVHQILA